MGWYIASSLDNNTAYFLQDAVPEVTKVMTSLFSEMLNSKYT
jgi:hypothetical protein